MVPLASGQATTYTALERLRLQEFGVLSYVRPAYKSSADTGTNVGVSVGADLDFATHIWMKPGIEIRATHSTGPVSTQDTFGFGPRVIAPFHRVEPYVDFLLSGGTITFHQSPSATYTNDRSAVYAYGGGADLLLSAGWAVKVDVQSQRWRLGQDNNPFHPLLVGVGVRYEVHGGKHSPQ